MSEKKPVLLVSACLLGENCRWDGGNNRCESVAALTDRYDLLPFCPEQAGGLPTPRPPCERQGDRVIDREGGDRTDAFRKGALAAVEAARRAGAVGAVLKERSPSCGVGPIYDGSFTRTLVEGTGVTAEALREAGLPLWGESEVGKR